MVNEVVVRIISERIINGGENPLRKRPFKLDDVTNIEYRKAVEDYILEHSNAIDLNVTKEIKEENTVESTESKPIEETTNNTEETEK